MKILKPFCLSIALLLAISGCVPPAGTAQTAEPASPVPPTQAPLPSSTPMPTAAPTVKPLTESELRNMEYTLPVSHKTVKLTDGKYQSGSGEEFLAVQMADPIGFGDVDGDGIADAGVVLGENTGGSGTFESLIAVLNRGGVPQQDSSVQLGDRVQVQSITIPDGRIAVEMITHGPQDPMCCPSQPVKEWFRLTQGGLFLDELVSQAANGVKRSIQIDKPAAGDQVGSTIQLTGSETVAPFENNLVYRVYDETNQQLGEGSITAKSEGTGGPVTFDAAVNLPTIPPGKEFWVSVMDLSAKDGSTLAQASVRLVSQQQ